MPRRYATDADLTGRIPETATADATLRGYALEDAAEMIDLDAYRLKSLRAHVMLAAHYLVQRGHLTGVSSSGPIQSWTAGEMSVTYATAAAEFGDPTLASTRYGQEFLLLFKSVPHEPIAV